MPRLKKRTSSSPRSSLAALLGPAFAGPSSVFLVLSAWCRLPGAVFLVPPQPRRVRLPAALTPGRARVPNCLSLAGFEGIYVVMARKVRQFGVGEGSQRGGREMRACALHRAVGAAMRL